LRYGTILSLKLVKNTVKAQVDDVEITNHCIIEYESEEVAKKVLDSRDDHELQGHKLTCSPFKCDKMITKEVP
jgi:hypothetical protein